MVDLGATSYRLESIPASAANFAASADGNNVNSKLYYTAGGVDYVITGKVSRQDKSGSTPIAFYFYDPIAVKGYLLVRRGYESSFSPNANVSTSSDFSPASLDTAATEDSAILTVGSASATEGSSLIHTVNLTSSATTSKTYAYSVTNGTATSGTDFNVPPSFSNSVTLSASNVTVPAGVGSFTITFSSIDDASDENNESYTVTVGGKTGTGTIVDNDGPAILTVSSASVTEGSSLVHTVTLSAATTASETYSYSLSDVTAAGGTDYNTTPSFSNGVSLSSGTLTVPSGVSSFTITFTSTNDTIDESSETYTLTINDKSGTGTINDDDASPSVSISVSPSSVNEDGVTSLTYTLTLSGTSAASTSVVVGLSGTATEGTDYTTPGNAFTAASKTFTIAAGALTTTFDADPTSDTTDEANETVIATISSVTNSIGGTIGTASATGTITNDDGAITPANDSGTAVSGTGSTAIADVRANDTVNGAAASS